MMSKIKMSEVFDLPVSPAGLFHKLSMAKVKDKNTHITHAINNHDRLVEENKILREMLWVVIKRSKFEKARIDNTIKDINNILPNTSVGKN